MTQEDVNILIRKLVFQGGDPFDIANEIYASHLRGQSDLLRKLGSDSSELSTDDLIWQEIERIETELKTLNQKL